MAVPTKPSLRSSRRSPYLSDTSPTVSQQKHPTAVTHFTKRPHLHDHSLTNNEHKPLKRPKLDVASRPKLSEQKHAAKSIASGSNISSRQVKHISPTIHNNLPPSTTNGALSFVNGIITINDDPPIPFKDSPAKVVRKKGEGKKIKVLKEVDKRSLRSQDGGSRSKSELSLYFPYYEEFISNEPRDTEILSSDTRIWITEESPKTPTTPTKYLSFSHPLNSPVQNGSSQTTEPPPVPFHTPTECQRIDLSTLARSSHHVTKDPLSDDVYFKLHRRAERQEKQLRNIERERAQHEKVQLERILEGLRGPDWLRVMGISGVTDSERKAFEPKRDHFIREVRSLIEKFRRWKEEEKRRKVEKEQSVKAEDDEDEAEDDDDDDEESQEELLDDEDTLAALQLHNESLSAHKSRTKYARAEPLQIERPFRSFFSKTYERDAAVGKVRRGRKQYAFGRELPDIPERDFNLPKEYLTKDELRASARRRRRVRRDSKV